MLWFISSFFSRKFALKSIDYFILQKYKKFVTLLACFFFNSIVCRLHTEASRENKVHTLFNDFTYGFIHYNLSYNSINDSLVTLFLVLIPLNMQKYQKIHFCRYTNKLSKHLFIENKKSTK